MDTQYNKLCVCKFGLAGGILWGLGMFIITLISEFTGYAYDFLSLMGTLYLGYEVSIMGSFIGLAYGFIDAFVGFIIFAWLYNFLCKHCTCCCKK